MTAMLLIYQLTRNWVDRLGACEVGQGWFWLVYPGGVLGLDSWRKFNWWWLCFDVIQDLLNYIWVSNVGDKAHGATTQWTHG